MTLHVQMSWVYPKNIDTCYTGPYTRIMRAKISCQMKFALLWPQHDMIGNHLSMISGSRGNDESVVALLSYSCPTCNFVTCWNAKSFC